MPEKVVEPEMIKIIQSTPPLDSLPAILRQEAIYCALGRLSRSMTTYGGVDFGRLLEVTASLNLPLYVAT